MKFVEKPELGLHMTFQPDKKRPIFNWFYYKEAFSSHLVSTLIKEFEMSGPVLDPFVGAGTVPLECKYEGIVSIGRDANPLAVLVSTVKCRNYDDSFITAALNTCERMLSAIGKNKERYEWGFELFSPEKAFPRRNIEAITSLRAQIDGIEDHRLREFMLVALVSILPQVSYVLKDGGVLKIIENKRAGDAKALFRKKVKMMLRDLRGYGVVYDEPNIEVGSAKHLNLQDNSVNGIITSPPYLNNVDYTKVYGMELSLLGKEHSVKDIRQNMVRSFIGRNGSHMKMEADYVYEKLAAHIGTPPPVAYAYFTDMLKVIEECHRVMRSGAVCAMVVGNTVLQRINIECDTILAEMAEDFGMESEVWVGSVRHADVPVKGKLPVRESAIIIRKI
ncbi:MAG: hypothetical protein QXS93_03030 [Candidatus Micrarchaeia archaeon]